MPDEEVKEQEQTQTQTEEPKEVTEADLDNMTQEQLEAFARGSEEKLEEQASGQEKPKEGESETKGDWIEVDLDDGGKARFKDQSEFIKSYQHAQSLIKRQKDSIDRFNAERGENGNLKAEYEQAKTQISELSQQIQQLQAGAEAVRTGQSPGQYTTNALAALRTRPGSRGQGAYQLLMNEVASLKNELLVRDQSMEELKATVQETVSGLQASEAKRQVDAGVQGLYDEVGQFLQKHPEYKPPTMDFTAIDDIVSTHGEEVARTMVGESDLAAYDAMMGIVGLMKNDQKGEFDLSRRNFKDLEEAWLVEQHRTGKLSETLAAAHRAGGQDYDKALTRGAGTATMLPNSAGSGQKPPQAMGEAELEAILRLPAEQIAADPELSKRFEEATTQLGISPSLM